MTKLPQLKPTKVMSQLKKNGFVERVTKSSHRVFVHPDGRRTVVAMHNRPLAVGTLKAILKQSGLKLSDLKK